MSERLTAGQHTVLRIISRRDRELDGAMSTVEVSDVFGHSVDSRIKTLWKRGLLERLGQTYTGSWCWGITDTGRAALANRSPDETSHDA